MIKSRRISQLILHYKDYFSNLWREGLPLCILFSTNDFDYIYDTGTNRILRCDKDEFILLTSLFDSVSDYENALRKYFEIVPADRAIKSILSVEDLINKKNILKISKMLDFSLAINNDSIPYKIKNDLGMLILETTQDCNLRCGYCVFRKESNQRRGHRPFHMQEETIRNAIQYYYTHSINIKDAAINFYGGEPLLRFPQIKNAVNYARNVFKDKHIRFNMTTNCTLIDHSIAKYLNIENFSVLASIDGPQHVHDLWRKN